MSNESLHNVPPVHSESETGEAPVSDLVGRLDALVKCYSSDRQVRPEGTEFQECHRFLVAKWYVGSSPCVKLLCAVSYLTN